MFSDTLGMRLRGAYLTFHRMANAHFEEFGMTADQFVVLTLLAESEGVTQREMVERAFSDPNTIGEMLGRLEKKQLVVREPHPHDGRARCVFLTRKGRKVQQKLWDGCKSRLEEIDGALEPKDLELLKSLLSRIPQVANGVRGSTKDAVA